MVKRLKMGFYGELLLMLLFVLLFVLVSSYKFDFLIWFVNVPLLLLVYNKPVKRALLLLLAPVILAVAISFTWVAEYSWHAYALSSAIFSSFLFLFAVIFNIASKKIKGYLRIFIAPFAYSLLMSIYSFSPINSYWADWSMFQNMIAPLVWLVGSNGITFLIILIHSVIAFYIIKKDKKILITGCMVFLFLLGNYVFSFNADPEGQRVKVALLQGNFNQDWEWRHANSREIIFSAYENMSIEASKSKPSLIVWPEYAIADDVLNNTDLMKRLSNLARKTNAHLVIGTVRFYDDFYENERLRSDVSLVFASDGKFIGEYISVKPIPFEKWVLPGNDTNIFYTNMGNFGVSLCYEETQKGVSKSFSSKKAQFLVSLANNQVLDETAGMYLTNLYTNVRAAENGKYLVRATNTGITKIVSPYGKVEAQLPPYARGILIGDIYLNDKITFYAKYGNLILNIFLFIFGVLFLKRLLH
ncbi:apolipoprotein N-acyltransferase [Candidatus Woesearchaeota archaeon]|nr:apolipoprotein N-acyltransferase [Candidatus Woesearchaeota archaeon]